MDRILLVTGRMAFDDVERVAKQFDNVYVDVLPISVAAFTTTRLLVRHGPGLIAKFKPDIIIISGMVQGDFTNVGEQLRTRVLKGTMHVSGLEFLLSNIDEFANDLSPVEPADGLIQEKQNEFYNQHIREIESKIGLGKRNFKLKSGVIIGIDVPPKVMAEVVDVTSRSIEESLRKATSLAQWADIIDLGSNIENPDPEKVGELVAEVRKLGKPVSVDTLNSNEILAGVDAGAELVLSIDRGNIDDLIKLPEDIALVCLPTNVSKGIYPSDPTERAKECLNLCSILERHGYHNLLADPLMEGAINPGMVNSLIAYHSLRKMDLDRQFLAGFGNITEFIDSDTSGVNALLACLGIELGISVFLTTEERAATMNCTKELQSACKMAYVSKIRESTPRDVGFSSFLAKSAFHDPQAVIAETALVDVRFDEPYAHDPDPKGCFRIGVDYQSRRILCQQKRPDDTTLTLSSDLASTLIRAIVTGEAVSLLDHAAYLGAELMKAEISLKLGRNYIQNEEWEKM